MPLPLELDAYHWIRFMPPGKSEVVKVLGNACYYSDSSAPPELEFPGKPVSAGSTELALNAEVTVEGPKWFLQKWTEAERKFTEERKPALLETFPVVSEGIGTSEILNEAVTAAKIAKEAVTAAKVQIATLPAIAAVKTVKTGTAGVDRVSISNLKGDGGTTLKYKIKHTLETTAIAVTCYSNNAGVPGTQITSAEMPVITVLNVKEVELTFGAGKPANEEVIWVKVEA